MESPAIDELVTAAREFLENTAMAQLKGHAAFHARVAANALAIVERELALGQAGAEAEAGRLRGLLKAEGTLAALNAMLCRRIADGEVTQATPGLAEHLIRTAMDKVAIDQPGYSGLKTARARWPSLAAHIPLPGASS